MVNEERQAAQAEQAGVSQAQLERERDRREGRKVKEEKVLSQQHIPQLQQENVNLKTVKMVKALDLEYKFFLVHV